MSTTTNAIEQSTISVQRVKEILGSVVNRDVNTEINDLNNRLKQYRTYKYQLDHKSIAEYEEVDGERVAIHDEVPDLDENGVQKTATRRDKNNKDLKVEVLLTKKKVRQHAPSEEEIKERQDYINQFKATKLEALTKKVNAYKQHKIKFSKNAIKVLVEFVDRVALSWLAEAGKCASKIAFEEAKNSKSNKKLPSKIKIRLMHLFRSDFQKVSGINAFYGSAFFEALNTTTNEDIAAISRTVKKELKKELKKEGYTKGQAAKEKSLRKKQTEELLALEEEATRFAGMSADEIFRIKKEEALGGKKKSPKKDAPKADKKKLDLSFVNFIKKNFKVAHNSSYSLSSEVTLLVENSIMEFMNHVAAYAMAICQLEDIRTFSAHHVIALVTGYSVGNLELTRKFNLQETEVVSEAALEEARAERARLTKESKFAPKVDKDSLPKETGYEALVTDSMNQTLSDSYKHLTTVLEAIEAEDKVKSDARKEAAAKKSVKAQPKKASKKASKKVEASDSDSEEEEVQTVKAKKVAKK